MPSSERRAARAANLGVFMVAATAAVISFSHVRAVALRSGESGLTSWLLPVSIDGAVVAAVSVLLADSRAGRRPAGLTWLLLAFGLSASLAANVAAAEPSATARAVAAWPPIALALGIEVLAGLARRGESVPSDREAGSRPPAPNHPASGAGTAGVNGTRLGPDDAGDMAGTKLARNRPNGDGQAAIRHAGLDDSAAVSVIRALDSASPAGPVSRLQIQKELGCGRSRAARLADLARRPIDGQPGSNRTRSSWCCGRLHIHIAVLPHGNESRRSYRP